MKKLLATSALAIAALGMVGGTASAAPRHHYMTAWQLAAKMHRLGCNATVGDTSGNWAGGIKPKTELDCTISGEDVTIDEYRTTQQQAYNFALAKGIGCSIAKAFGSVPNVTGVEADNWTITPATAITARAIQHAVGSRAKIYTIHCG